MAEVNATKSYVDTQDNELRFEFQQLYEDFTHQVTHILESYEDYLTGRIGSIHDEVWEGVDSVLSTSSTAPVQNKVITNALNNKANNDHNHDSRYYTETEINNLLNNKVSIINGKGLSTNDYTNEDKTIVQQANSLIIAAGNNVLGVKGNAELLYRTGNVNITPANIGLENVDNTSDLNKPISTATQVALDTKVDKVEGKILSTNDFDDNYKNIIDNLNVNFGVTIDDVLDIESNNPLKNRVITANLNLKAPINSPNFTGIPTAVTAAEGTNTTQLATTAFVQNALEHNIITINIDNDLDETSTNPVENQVITAALNLKAPLNNANLTGIPTAPTATIGTNTTQIATTGFVNNAINALSQYNSFQVIYQTTDPNEIYNKYEDGYYIYCIYEEQIYTLNYALKTNESLILQLVSIGDNTIHMMDIAVVEQESGYSSETWHITDQLLVNSSLPEVYTYPIYRNFNSSTPEPTLDGQFVTKKYVDDKTNIEEVPIIYYSSGEFELDSSVQWFNYISNGKKVILNITYYQAGLTDQEDPDPDYICLTNSDLDSYTFTGNYYGSNEYIIIRCILTYNNDTSKYYWNLKTINLTNNNTENAIYAGRIFGISNTSNFDITNLGLNGKNWTELTFFNNYFFVFLQTTNNYAYSQDGMSWIINTLPAIFLIGGKVFVVNNKMFCCTGDYIYYSDDGINWSTSDQLSQHLDLNSLSSLNYINDTYYLAWTETTSSRVDNENYVAESGYLCSSTNCINWTIETIYELAPYPTHSWCYGQLYPKNYNNTLVLFGIIGAANSSNGYTRQALKLFTLDENDEWISTQIDNYYLPRIDSNIEDTGVKIFFTCCTSSSFSDILYKSYNINSGYVSDEGNYQYPLTTDHYYLKVTNGKIYWSIDRTNWTTSFITSPVNTLSNVNFLYKNNILLAQSDNIILYSYNI